MTLNVLEDHSPIAGLLKCSILYFWHVARSLCICIHQHDLQTLNALHVICMPV